MLWSSGRHVGSLSLQSWLYCRTDSVGATILWSSLYGACSNDKVVLLFMARKLFYIIPAHFFSSPEGYDAFRQLASERAGELVRVE